jgi:chromosome partitioning protein
MKPFIIAFLSHKGGSGKTTGVLNIATAAQEDGKAVIVIDLDDGASATDWYRARIGDERLQGLVAEKLGDEWAGTAEQLQLLNELRDEWSMPLVQPTHHAGIAGMLAVAEKQGVDWVLIDTKGGTERASMAALEVADLVITPLLVSQMDLRQSVQTVRLCSGQGKPPVALLGDFDAVGPEESDTRSALKDAGVEVLPGGLGHRKAYKRSIIPGLGVVEFEPKGAAADEVRRLYKHLRSMIDRKHADVSARQREQVRV